MIDTASATFLVTGEYRRFCEFADAVRRDRYIGLCYGPPGVGKTLSARHYAHWDAAETYLARSYLPLDSSDWVAPLPPDDLAESRTVVWTTPIMTASSRISRNVSDLCRRMDTVIRRLPTSRWRQKIPGGFPHVELLICDEADRLTTTGLEELRDLYDRSGIGLILVGMPGLQRRLARYPQLYSRVGFAHEYRPLARTELLQVITGHHHELGLALPDGVTLEDPDALTAITQITGGNLRLVQRLFTQINRIIEINNLTGVTRDVVETARSSLIIGGP
ncbi:MAG: ATP-binding protein [Microbacteriaceae bacterium]|nr:MAG: ATP-binding protein [Microbacteriaceae bacterium]